MFIILLGSIGIGLVWGWLLILLSDQAPAQRPLVNLLVLSLATLLVAWQLFLFTDWRAVAFFLVSAVLSLLLHLGWRYALRNS